MMGDMMQLKLFNTMTREKEVFSPLMDEGKVDKVLIYSCGPTVYGYAHIGNFRSWYFADILKRTIKHVLGYPVKHSMNITDVGHLTDDGDHGEDKMEKGSKRDGLSVWDIAQKYENIFKENMLSLQMDIPDQYPRATDYIKEQITVVQRMYEKGLTYVIPGDGIYCDTSKIADYGKLLPPGHLEGLKEGARVDATGKKNLTDFALWKYSPQDQQREMEWVFEGGRSGTLIIDDTGNTDHKKGLIVKRKELTQREIDSKGFPGWHVECSAMSWATLGKNIDIHTGGIDHIPVHHTNEIVQSECSFCAHTPWVKIWMHNQFLNINNDKIAKSMGNVVCVSDVLDQGFDPLDLRFFYHQAHYRSFQDFSWESLTAAQSARRNLAKKLQVIDFGEEVKMLVGSIKSVYDLIDTDETRDFLFGILEALFDDLQIPQVLARIQEGIRDLTIGKLKVVYWFDEKVLRMNLCSFNLKSQTQNEDDIPEEVGKLAEKRWEAKKAKDWARSDALRDQVRELGYEIVDEGERWKIKRG